MKKQLARRLMQIANKLAASPLAKPSKEELNPAIVSKMQMVEKQLIPAVFHEIHFTKTDNQHVMLIVNELLKVQNVTAAMDKQQGASKDIKDFSWLINGLCASLVAATKNALGHEDKK